MTKELVVTRWGVGGPEEKIHEFDDTAVLEALEDGNIHVLDDHEGTAIAFFGGVASAWWKE